MTDPKQGHAGYRPDIDGLRALAVLAVVGYHAFMGWMPGGFVGVDCFFVISGFLISGLIFKDLDRGRFSVTEFYARRARRILPALAVVLLATLGLGALTLIHDDWRKLGTHVLAGAGFFSNLQLWRESGYFDSGSELKPLLHLWSLGIEEQFYLIWPLVLILGHRFARGKRPLPLILALAAGSFALCVALMKHHPTAAFYWPVARLWELALGAALAAIADGGGRRAARGREAAISVLGLALIVASLAALDKDSPFPGWLALPPAAGTALVILAGPNAWLNRAVLSNRRLVFIGLISYPLYLWHWPLLALARHADLIDLNANDDRPLSRAALVAVSFALAWLTYELVEKPLRRVKVASLAASRQVVATGAAALVVLGTTGQLVRAGRLELGLQRRSQAVSYYNYFHGRSEKEFWGASSCFRFEGEGADFFERHGCLAPREQGKPSVFLIGDSHSAYLSLGLRPFLAGNRLSFSQFSAGWCTPFAVHDRNESCAAVNSYVLEKVRQARPDLVVLFADYIRYGSGFDAFTAARATELRRAGARRVLIVGQMPSWRRGLPTVLARAFLSRNLAVPRRTADGLLPESLAMDGKLRARAGDDGLSYFSLRDLLCDASGCVTYVGPELSNSLIVFDEGHLTAPGARYVVENGLGAAILGQF